MREVFTYTNFKSIAPGGLGALPILKSGVEDVPSSEETQSFQLFQTTRQMAATMVDSQFPPRPVFARLPAYNPFVGTFHHAPR